MVTVRINNEEERDRFNNLMNHMASLEGMDIRFRAMTLYDEAFDTRKWMVEVPFLDFPSHFIVKPIPPFAGAIVRFLVADRRYPDLTVSTYLDCYDQLGIMGKPYWEIYPHKGDTKRYWLNETDELINGLIDAVEILINQEGRNV